MIGPPKGNGYSSFDGGIQFLSPAAGNYNFRSRVVLKHYFMDSVDVQFASKAGEVQGGGTGL